MNTLSINGNSNALTMSEAMHNELDKFFAEKTIIDVDRNTYLNLNLHDRRYKIIVSLVFMRDFDGLEINSYRDVVIEGNGVIFIFPPYWISIPKELAITYFEYIINDFYANTVSTWIQDGIIGNGSGVSSGNTPTTGTGCGCSQPTAVNPIFPCNII